MRIGAGRRCHAIDVYATVAYLSPSHRSGPCVRHALKITPFRASRNNPLHNLTPTLHPCLTLRPPLPPTTHPRRSKETTTTEITHRHHPTQRGVIPWMFVYIHGCTSVAPHDGNCGVTEGR